MKPLTLASGSAIRAKILTDAGIAFSVVRPNVDEAALKTEMTARGANIAEVAVALAREKARVVAADVAGLVLASDQILEFEGRAYDKAENLGEARERLAAMRGREHHLISATVLSEGPRELAILEVCSTITLRPFSDAFLDDYIKSEGEGILSSVACYKFEERGAQLFASVTGDHYAILGLPLLAVLAALREHGGLAE